MTNVEKQNGCKNENVDQIKLNEEERLKFTTKHCVCMCVCMCVRACVHACVRACMRVCACVLLYDHCVAWSLERSAMPIIVDRVSGHQGEYFINIPIWDLKNLKVN